MLLKKKKAENARAFCQFIEKNVNLFPFYFSFFFFLYFLFLHFA